MNESYSIELDSRGKLLQLILEEELNSKSMVIILLVSVENEVLSWGLINFSILDLAHGDDACSIDVVAKVNIGLSFLQSTSLTSPLVDVNYRGISRWPDNVPLTALLLVQLWLIHDLELDDAADVHIDRREWFDHTRHTYLEYVKD